MPTEVRTAAGTVRVSPVVVLTGRSGHAKTMGRPSTASFTGGYLIQVRSGVVMGGAGHRLP